MSYYSGTAGSWSELRQAFIDACALEGWTWDGASEVLSKGDLFVRLQVVDSSLQLLGRTSASGGDAPGIVQMRQIGATLVAFPLSYELFAWSTEVYLVINYAGDYYQWAAFGQSTVSGMPGTGMWIGASCGAAASSSIYLNGSTGGNTNSSSGGLFAGTYAETAAARNCWVHSDLDGQGWLLAQALTGEQVGGRALSPLLNFSPSDWSGENVLLPLRAWKLRPAYKASLVADLEYARLLTLRYYEPGQIIDLDTDRWKVLPWYRWFQTGVVTNADHSGYYGWAIRYEGP